MPTPSESRPWKSIAATLKSMDAPTLRALIHDLYKLAPENRAFLASWLGDEDASLELLDAYKAKIAAQFITGGAPRLNGGCDFALCRRLIKEYRRVTTARELVGGFDIRGTIDLGLDYLEVGTNYLTRVGWDDERPYLSLSATADELSELCRAAGGQRWAQVFLPRVRTVATLGNGFGYSYSDALAELADTFESAAAAFAKRRAAKSDHDQPGAG